MSDNVLAITKSIKINALAKEVWDALFGSTENYSKWAGVFSPTSYAKTDWKQGSQAIFADETNSGLIGIITTSKYPELLEITYTGEVVNGQPVYDSPMALIFKNGVENYRLTEQNGVTTLDINSDMMAEMVAEMSQQWDKALQIVKEIAENDK